MNGDARRRQIAIEEQVAVHWHAAQMQALAAAGKLSPLNDWLDRVRPHKPRSVRDMIVALQDAAARGAPIAITKVEG